MAGREVISTGEAPQPVGAYSQGVSAGGLLFTAGQIALEPGSGKLVAGDVGAQARRVLENLAAVLRAGGATLADVVKTTVYLADIADAAAVNAVYGTYFAADPPARTTVAAAGLPLGAAVEIEAVAVRPG